MPPQLIESYTHIISKQVAIRFLNLNHLEPNIGPSSLIFIEKGRKTKHKQSPIKLTNPICHTK